MNASKNKLAAELRPFWREYSVKLGGFLTNNGLNTPDGSGYFNMGSVDLWFQGVVDESLARSVARLLKAYKAILLLDKRGNLLTARLPGEYLGDALEAYRRIYGEEYA